MAKYSSILFDLDGNLLPMDMDNFIKLYFGALAQYMAPYGFEPKEFIDGIWAGTMAMVKNDGTMANEERFWNTFAEKLGKRVFDYVFTIDSFYTKDFNKAKTSTWENPNAMRAIEAAHKIADRVVLATNPLFPPCAVHTRLGWIDIEPDNFDYITTYDNSRYCKPNPKYYAELAEKLGLDPATTLMVGNDIDEDGAAAAVGFDVFITTDCMLGNKDNLANFRHGTFAELCDYLESL